MSSANSRRLFQKINIVLFVFGSRHIFENYHLRNRRLAISTSSYQITRIHKRKTAMQDKVLAKKSIQ